MIGKPRLSFWDTSSRPSSPRTGTYGFNSETNKIEFWNGTNWKTFTPDP